MHDLGDFILSRELDHVFVQICQKRKLVRFFVIGTRPK